MMNVYRKKITLHLAAIACSVLLSACLSNGKKSSGGGSASTGNSAVVIKPVVPPITPTGPSLVIQNVTIAEESVGTSGSQKQVMTNLIFSPDGAQGTPGALSQFCTINSSSSNCGCQFQWSQQTNDGTGGSFTRKIITPVSSIVDFTIKCIAPPAFTNEITSGTQINISLIPTNGNSTNFRSNVKIFTKSGAQTDSNFTDLNGISFSNIRRYTCHERFFRSMNIRTKAPIQNQGDPQSEVVTPSAVRFCLNTISESLSSGGLPNGNLGDGCQQTDAPDLSAQSYYYNLFIKEKPDIGSIIQENARYHCPTVDQGLINGVNSGPKHWPLDSQFALAQTRTTSGLTPITNTTATNNNYTVGVESPSVLGSTDNAIFSRSSNCAGGVGEEENDQLNSQISSKCIGFATQPRPNGTCAPIQGRNGIIKTYRLRRYIAFYPHIFDTNGVPVNQPHALDVAYILDRPVNTTGSLSETSTITGPKPCPYAYFDHKGVNNSVPNYYSTNDPIWNGKQIDDIHFPNIDSSTSCSALMPIVTRSPAGIPNKVSFATTNQSNSAQFTDDGVTWNLNKVFVRPMTAWAPHYEEDTSFRACAPESNAYIDPPLFFAKLQKSDNGGAPLNHIGWCAAVYPNAHTNTANNTTYSTSGLVSSANIKRNIPNAIGTPIAREALSRPNNSNQFPIQAFPSDIFEMLRKDPSYGCNITQGLKAGRTPATGCCSLPTSFRPNSGTLNDTLYREADSGACPPPAD